MYYTLSLVPFSETEMELDIAAQKKNKAKIITQKKLKVVYTTLFSKAVRTYNNQAVSDSFIGDYYQAIKESNIPEVYQLNLTVIFGPNENVRQAKVHQAIQKFYKTMSSESYLSIVAAYEQNGKEQEALTMYFVPKAEGYASGLLVRSDLIDAVCRLYNISDDECAKMPLVTAIQYYSDYLKEYWKDFSNNMPSQEEQDLSVLEELDTEDQENSPLKTHEVAAAALKDQLQRYETLQNENQNLQLQMEQEQKRIESSFDWVAEKTDEIKLAEKKRLEQEELARKEEEQRKAAEQANVLAANRMKADSDIRQKNDEQKDEHEEMKQLSPSKLKDLVAKHQNWMKKWDITAETRFDSVSDEALHDADRLLLKNTVIANYYSNATPIPLIGVVIEDCTFENARLAVDLQYSEIKHCSFKQCWLSSAHLVQCQITDSDLSDLKAEDIDASDTVVQSCIMTNARLLNCIFVSGVNTFEKNNFEKTIFSSCDMKGMAFALCNLFHSQFIGCDLRNVTLTRCNETGCEYKGSITRYLTRK